VTETPAEIMARIPKQCSFCGLAASDAVKLHGSVSFAVEPPHTSALCSDCIRNFILSMAHDDRAEFEKLVEEARSWRPEIPAPETPENSN
jgi:hypothetical protein